MPTLQEVLDNFQRFWELFFPEQHTLHREEVLTAIGDAERGGNCRAPDDQMAVYQNDVAGVYGAYEAVRYQLYTLCNLLESQQRGDLRPDQHLVSLGCGPASYELWLMMNQGPGRVTLVDHSPAMLARARSIAERLGVSERVTTIVSDATSSGLPPKSADWVFCLNGMHWSSNWRRWIYEAGRILKPGGTGYLSCTLKFPRSRIQRGDFEAAVQNRFGRGAEFDHVVPPRQIGEHVAFDMRYYAVVQMKVDSSRRKRR